jgi:hypothetical protein
MSFLLGKSKITVCYEKSMGDNEITIAMGDISCYLMSMVLLESQWLQLKVNGFYEMQ